MDPYYGGTISYEITGVAPNRTFILDFNNVATEWGAGPLVTVQVILYETSNLIEVHTTSQPLLAYSHDYYTRGVAYNHDTEAVALYLPGEYYDNFALTDSAVFLQHESYSG